MVFAKGHTMAREYNMDSLGKLYASIATAWTVILLMGATFLLSRRDLPYLRMRNIPLSVSAVATIHVYWVLCMVAYILNGYFPCAAEFWIMSIYLPLGIALFQACNTQLLHIADLQKKYTINEASESNKHTAPSADRWHKYLTDLYAENRVKRIMAFIAYGMVVQVVLTLAIFLVSFKFHEGFGATAWTFSTAAKKSQCAKFTADYPGSSCIQAKKIACRKGWEWLPSIFWQVVWTWCYAPYLLWELRDVKDVHGWRRQTVFCCLAGLFATPMWLCSLYVPSMSIVNQYYIPPLWFAPSIFLIEAFLIFVPCWQVLKNHHLQVETLNIIAEWEIKNNGSSIGADTMGSNSYASKRPSKGSSTSGRRGEMYTMAALDSAVRTNPHRLLYFAAHKDFSGENISFLMKVLDWKRGWSLSSPSGVGFHRKASICESNRKELQRRQFSMALDIYTSCVSLRYSDYPINLSHAHLKELETVFEGATVMVHGHVGLESDDATPFDRLWRPPRCEDVESCPSKDVVSIASTRPTNAPNNSTDDILDFTDYVRRQTTLQTYEMAHMNDQLPEYIPVPCGFGPEVFDRAEESIKYMVLTNTWPKFVNVGYANNTAAKKKSLLQALGSIFLGRKI